MKKFLLIWCFLFALIGFVKAQSTVTGKVTGAEGNGPLPGVTVLEKGTSNGAVTDVDGNYSISVGADAVLVFSSVGFQSREVNVGAQSTLNVILELDIETLEEVVVTAYGIERDAKAVGYATSSVKPEDFAEAKQISVVQSLAGKVAGVNVVAPPTGPGGSTNILIRGVRSFNRDNRPLIVIDGVPVNNDIFGPAGRWGGRDTGDGLSSLNPDDIKSIDILKGSAASTLYGPGGQNGVVLVTTKKGKRGSGIGVELNSNFVFDQVALFPKFQDRYGQGEDGEVPSDTQDAKTISSWGGLLNGQSVISFDGAFRPYSPIDRKKNLKNYFETGSTFTNTLAITGGNKVANGRLSISHLGHEGVVPNTTFDRLSLNIVTSMNLGDKVVAEVKANYIREESLNRPNLSDNPSNPAKALSRLPPNVDINALRDNVRDADGDPVLAFSDIYVLNPYWGPFENINSDTRDRFIGYFKLGYKITDWLTLQGRISLDTWERREENLEEIGTAHNVNGAVWNDERTVRTESHDLLLIGNNYIGKEFSVNYTLGATQFTNVMNFTQATGNTLVLQDRPRVTNAINQNPTNVNFTKVRQNALLGNVNIGYKGFAFIDVAGRNDWLSTLTNPADLDGSKNTLFYGSVSGSFILSEAVDLPAVIDFAKFRLSYGTAGGGTNPFRTALVYELQSQKFNGASNGNIKGNEFPNPFILPNLTTSTEVGTNVVLLNNRLSADFTYYQSNTDRQIVGVQLSRTTGYEKAVFNTGEVKNRGVELLLTGVPVATRDFSWEVSLNMARNTGEVISIVEGLDRIAPTDDPNARFANVSIQHVVGETPAAIFGNKIMRDDQGRIVHNAEGFPMAEADPSVLGNFNPDFIAGLTNTVSYKDFSLSFLIDTKQGGEMFSITKFDALRLGLDPQTLVGREGSDFTMVGAGVNEEGANNTVAVDVSMYYDNLANIGESSVVDASYIKLREVNLSYSLPASVISNTPFRSVKIGLVGRNLFFLQNKVADLGIDPEGLYNNTNAAGLEYASLPSTRSYGINLNVKFK